MVIVPNVEQIAREMTGSSQIMIIISRMMKLKLVNLVRFGINNLPYALQILHKDFAAGIKVLCELEIMQSLGNAQDHFVLHSQMVDMAVALKNKRVISYYFGLAKKYGFQPGLLTYNADSLIKTLADVKNIPSNLVIYTHVGDTPVLQNYFRDSPIQFRDLRS
ncbi:MAG: hypothetical protein UX64_C0014G0008 [Microgenomates group bacterium GW2011_GWC2_46_7]|nr:MAG: hypothetical protein UX64_C0014G0008 [Microgenomates group bacterium GW2011_GWC2_46_7]